MRMRPKIWMNPNSIWMHPNKILFHQIESISIALFIDIESVKNGLSIQFIESSKCHRKLIHPVLRF